MRIVDCGLRIEEPEFQIRIALDNSGGFAYYEKPDATENAERIVQGAGGLNAALRTLRSAVEQRCRTVTIMRTRLPVC